MSRAKWDVDDSKGIQAKEQDGPHGVCRRRDAHYGGAEPGKALRGSKHKKLQTDTPRQTCATPSGMSCPDLFE